MENTAIGFVIPKDDDEADRMFRKLGHWARWYDALCENERRKRKLDRKRKSRKHRYKMRQKRRNTKKKGYVHG